LLPAKSVRLATLALPSYVIADELAPQPGPPGWLTPVERVTPNWVANA
jgi:hypothetical protein